MRSRDAGAAAISAHQGGAEIHPAQTYEAYQAAAEAGVEFVELDVRRLPDGTLVCWHDPVDARSYPELCARVGREVPRLERVLTLLSGRARGHLDLKETGCETEVVAMALDALGPTGFVVTSMIDASLHRIARLPRDSPGDPTIATGLSLGRGLGDVPLPHLPSAIVGDLFPARRLRAAEASWASINKHLAPWVLGRCARIGVATMVWTVDRTEQMDRILADPRVDVLVTNRPFHALECRRRLESAR